MLILAPYLLSATAAPDFASRLWLALPRDKGNVVVSPTSIETCLALLIPGVGPASQAPLAKTLGTSAGELPAYEQALKKKLGTLTTGDETTVSNAAFFAVKPKPTYVTQIADLYDATAEPMKADLTKQVNDWVNDKTKGRIPKLFDQLDRNATRMVLLNAVTFDGIWKLPFPKAATKKAAFNGKGEVEMMRLSRASLLYGEAPEYRSVQIPYEGGRYLMTVLLPTSGDPAKLLETDAWRNNPATTRPVDLSLPKFTVRSSPEVQAALGKMGLAPLYQSLDFRKALTDRALQIDQIAHRTYVQVDEKGTKAAASTGITVTRAAPAPTPPIVFRVDRPFAFVIQNVGTGELLFEGVIREL